MRLLTPALAMPLLSLAMFAPGAAQAASVIDGYNLFVLNNLSIANGDTKGRIAVKNDATLTSYSVAGSASASTTNFVVGGNLTASNGSAKGSTIVGGTASASVGIGKSFATNLLPAGSTLPIDFTAASTFLLERSAALSGFSGSAVAGSGGLTINATTSGLNVFSMTAAQLAQLTSTSGLAFNFAAGAKVLINVSGTSVTMQNFQMSLNGGAASDILWNFSDATSLSMQSIGMLGSVLAPKATFTGSGQMSGTLIVNNIYGNDWGGTVELHDDGLYIGDLFDTPGPGPVPEPATWAMMIVGFGAVGVAMRRRRRTVAFA